MFTTRELEQARALKRAGLSWVQVAERFGNTTAGSLKSQVCRFEQGKRQKRLEAHLARVALVERLVEQGASDRELAEAIGLKWKCASVWLWRHGFPLEVRQEYRQAA